MLRAKTLITRASVRHTRAFSSNIFRGFEMGPKDPILGVTEAFNADNDERKISVGVGAYRTDDAKPFVLPSVVEAERRIIESGHNMEYAPIDGLANFRSLALDLAYGSDNKAITDNVAACQSLSGTGALRLAAAMVSRAPKLDSQPTVFLPNPTWGNHFPIFEHAGLKTATYRYYDPKTLGLDLDGMLEDIKATPVGSVVLLHACAHNPTGVDPTAEQWDAISKACKDRFVLFDNAYQGFASGNTDKDAFALRHFVNEGHKVGLCQSFAKNLGLYGHRVGMFSILANDPNERDILASQIKIAARAMYSSPPLHGARIVAEVLGDKQLNAQWQSEIQLMSGRIMEMRTALKEGLAKAGSTKNWDHITNQIGMFSFTGLTVEQCDAITEKHHVYLTKNGRISMAGVTSHNVQYLADAIHDVTK